jgi:hypothetical protein
VLAPSDDPPAEPTIASTWVAVSGSAITDDLLDWPPDVFALTDSVIERSESYRFAVSPPAGRQWPPSGPPAWSDLVASTAQEWCARVQGGKGSPPDHVLREWAVLRAASSTPIEDVASGQAWRTCEALLTLHAIADEACAGMGVTIGRRAGPAGVAYRARGRELLARTRSMSRISPQLLRVLPKVRTPGAGISFRSLSRYACVRGPTVDVKWHRISVRPPGRGPQQASILLLPWPLHVEAGDFCPVPGSLRRAEMEPFGFFQFSPSEAFDISLVDGVLRAAREEVDRVDVVVLPEGSLPRDEIQPLEAVLARHGVVLVMAGVREPMDGSGDLPSNWVHLSVWLEGRWWHCRQNKHHRWYLDRSQIEQYHLEAALDPAVRWWEDMQVPRRSVQFMELGDGITVASVVCEDLARIDEVADLLRVVGPTLVVTILLDGPQLASRWTARYASVLADDPGSAVLTLSSYGMVQRSWREGQSPSSVVALWKDPVVGLQEIALEPDAHGILISANFDRAIRRSADGRMPVHNTADLHITGIKQVRASPTDRVPLDAAAGLEEGTPLQTSELTVLSSWSEAVTEAVAMVPDSVEEVLANAAAGGTWRAGLSLEQPAGQLAAALDGLAQIVRSARAGDAALTLDGLLAVLSRPELSHDPLMRLISAVMRPLVVSRLSL